MCCLSTRVHYWRPQPTTGTFGNKLQTLSEVHISVCATICLWKQTLNYADKGSGFRWVKRNFTSRVKILNAEYGDGQKSSVLPFYTNHSATVKMFRPTMQIVPTE